MRAKMVAAAFSTPTTSSQSEQHSKRPPLLNTNTNNGTVSNKKPKSKPVSSRYMSPSTSSTSTSNSSSISSNSSSSTRRYASPSIPRSFTPNTVKSSSIAPKRSVSADRRRIVRPLTADLDVSVAEKLLVNSTRSLSVSFQGQAFSLPVCKTKATPVSVSPIVNRKLTPERKRSVTPLRGGGGDQVENYRWPGRNRSVVNSSNSMFRSVDCSAIAAERSKVIGSMNVGRNLVKTMNNERFSGDCEGSDTDSVSSGSSGGRNVAKGIVVSSKFWQETNSRLRRLQDPSSPKAKLIVPPKMKRFSSDGPVSSPRTVASPSRGGMIRPASPSRAMTPTPVGSRGHSPSRIRNVVSTISNKFNETPSVLSYAVDVKRGKVGENKIVDAHLLRILYNRHLQWRFVNARTESVLMLQKHSAEKNLWNAWITISNLRDTVTKKRHRLQLLRQKLKLASILRGQMISLEEWASLDKDHSTSLLGAIEALKASTLRLPVVGAVNADAQSLKDAIGSAVDVMHAMGSSISLLLPTVEEVNSLVTELAKATAKERALLEQCKDFVSLLAAMQVKDSSLRTHILQHNRVPATA